MSFIATIYAEKGSLLLGGVAKHVSCRMETQEMAENFCQTVAEINREAGRQVASWSTRQDSRPPEITEADIGE